MGDTETRKRRKQKKVPDNTKQESLRKDSKPKAGFSILRIFFYLAFITIGIGIFGFFNSELRPVIIEAPNPVDFEGFLKPSDVLERGERILLDQAGPESFAVDTHGYVYTGLANGWVVKIHPSATGDIAEGLVEIILKGPIAGVEPIDGHIEPRPLGLRLFGDILYVIDAYYGVYTLNVVTKEVLPLVKPEDVQPSLKLPNDLDVTKDERYIYFTDTSSKWNLKLLYNDLLEGDCLGRLFRYNTKTGKINTIASKLCFPNGVQLSADEKTLAVSETTRYRVLFFNLENESVDKVTVVPGMPDNIRRSAEGGYWVAVPLSRTPIINFMADHPILRRIYSGLVPLKLVPFLSPPKKGLAVELDANGDIINSIDDVTGKKSKMVSEIYESKEGILLAGSYHEPYIIKCRREQNKKKI